MGDSGDQNRRSSPVVVAPRTATSYLDPHYWGVRFATEEHYEWFKDYSHFQHLLRPFLNRPHSIGCGYSRLCEELRKDGVADMTCVDISPVAVERMRSRFRDKGLEGIKVVRADMLGLPFGSESFDIVIEKGTMVSRSIPGQVSRSSTGHASRTFPSQASRTFPGQTSRAFFGQVSRSIPGQVSRSSIGQASRTFPGQASRTFPGQASRAFLGQVSRSIPGQVSRSSTGQASKTFPGQASRAFLSQASRAFPGQAFRSFPGQASRTPLGRCPRLSPQCEL
ncbi:hypothetical protein ZIOFF_029428 [Zingiber officinale]|uniref:Methyltransferase domain-containing protein n=1 Tax=Zingiber officinale TaxID=94328 RepID=A0A8J5H834_ZINOF|nr:hypothetical protein ZIOFF_029428 [Zingiber officinale]